MPEQRPSRTRYVALLRGVNVGRHKRIAMSDLRSLLTSIGLGDVSTHLASGNALFTSGRRDMAGLTKEIESTIAERLGADIRVVLRTHHDLARVIDSNPLPEATDEPSRFLVAFMATAPDAERVKAFDVSAFQPDEIRFGPRTAYVWYRNGVQGSKLSNDVLERRLGVTATARNWNTVLSLVALAATETTD